MYKKVICLVMCLTLLLLPSCGKDEGTTGNLDGGVPCPIEGLEWGMTVDECLTALSLTEDDVEIEKQEGDNTIVVTIKTELSGLKAYGYPVEGFARLILYENLEGLPVGFHNLWITFDKFTPVEDLQAAVKEQVKSYMVEDDDPNNALASTNSQRYNTSKTLADADQEMADNYLAWVGQRSVPSGSDLPGKEDYPYGFLYVGKDAGGQVFVCVDNTIATILEKAGEAEKQTSK